MQHIIVRPIITEKSMTLANQGKFSFVVDKSADKTAIKKAIEKTFSVKVVRIVTLTVKGKTKRVGVRRVEVVQPAIKKAIVTVLPGQKIDLFEIGGSA